MPEVRVVVSTEMDRYMDTVVQRGMFGSKAELIRAALIRYIETMPVRVPAGYDDTTLFSPDGRIFQVEYAMEATTRGVTIVGLRYLDGVILAKEKPPVEKAPPTSQMLTTPGEEYQIDRHLGIVPSGLVGDFILLKTKAVEAALAHRETKGHPIPVEKIAATLALLMHSYTTQKDIRPLGCALLLGGIDSAGCHLFEIDPSGLYREVLMSSYGLKRKEAAAVLTESYQSDMSFTEALQLTVRAILRDASRTPEELTAAVINSETKTLSKIPRKTISTALKTAFKP
ncbi:MAG: proteasome subunit alpha [Promethearchaeota archaeon]